MAAHRARIECACALALVQALVTACGPTFENRESQRTTPAKEASAQAAAAARKNSGAAADATGDPEAGSAAAASAKHKFTPTPADGNAPGEPAPGPPPDHFDAGIYFAVRVADNTDSAAIFKVNDAGGAGRVPGLKDLPASGFALGATTVISFEFDPAAPVESSSSLVIAAVDGSARRVLSLPGIYAPARPTLAPDESEVAFEALDSRFGSVATAASIYVVDLASGGLRVASFDGDNHAPVWFPIARRLAYVSYDQFNETMNLDIVDADDDATYIISSGSGGVGLAVSPDEAEIFVASTGKVFSAHSLAPGKSLASLVTSGASALGLKGFRAMAAAYAPDGSGIVLAGTLPGPNAENAAIVRIGRDGGDMTSAFGPAALPTGTEGGVPSLDVSFNWRP